MNSYYYMDDTLTAKGPVTTSELPALGVTLDTLVWAEGMADWVPARTLADVREALESYVPQTQSFNAPFSQPSTTPTTPQSSWTPPTPPDAPAPAVAPPTNIPPQTKPFNPQQPPTYGGYNFTPEPRKNNSNTVLIAVICVLVTLLLAGLAWFLFGRSSESPSREEAPVRRDTVVVHEKETIIEREAPAAPRQAVVPTNATHLRVTGTNVCLRLSPEIPSGRDKYSNCLKYTNGTNVHPAKGASLPYRGEYGDFYRTTYQGYDVYISRQFSQPY